MDSSSVDKQPLQNPTNRPYVDEESRQNSAPPPPYTTYGSLQTPFVVAAHRRRACCGNLILNLIKAAVVFFLLGAFAHASFRFNPDPVIDRCYIDRGRLWDGSGSFDFDVSNYTGVAVQLDGGISVGHVSILRTDDATVTTGTVHLSVYYSDNIDPSTISVRQRSYGGIYQHTLVTDHHFRWRQCLVARWTIVLPYQWDNATRFLVSVENSAINVAQVVEELEFDNALLQTTNGRIDIGGLSAGLIDIRSTNGAIGGQVSPGKSLAVWTTNGGIDLESQRGGTQSIFVRTTNGNIKGLYTAMGIIKLETTNGLIDVRAEARILDVTTTNGGIRGEYRAETIASLWTTNARVAAEVEAGNITVRTTNGRITGVYLAEGTVDVETMNGEIDIREGNGKDVILRTSNGRISGEYFVEKSFEALTSNEPIDVHINLKEDAGLKEVYDPKVTAVTSYGRIYVVLSDTFTGRFDVATTYGRATVQNCLSSPEECDQSDIVFERNTHTAKSGFKVNEGHGLISLRSRGGDAELFFVTE